MGSKYDKRLEKPSILLFLFLFTLFIIFTLLTIILLRTIFKDHPKTKTNNDELITNNDEPLSIDQFINNDSRFAKKNNFNHIGDKKQTIDEDMLNLIPTLLLSIEKKSNKKQSLFDSIDKDEEVNKPDKSELKPINHKSLKFKPEERVYMVINKVESHRDSLLDMSRNLIRQQNRAPDSRYNINVTNSDLQSLDRSILDTRPPICATFKYNRSNLPKASVIIPFYNEALSMLLRTIHSILNRSPDELLEEVILVDDCSPDLHLQQPLTDYLKLLPKVKIVRNDKRFGLIVSRMRGARMAKAQILIFMDAHSEVNNVWLEPLLHELQKNKRQVLQPFTDAIDAMSLDIGEPGIYHRGSFSWDLRYTWIRVTDHEQKAAYDTGLPFPTPTLVGCAIAVDKDYFEEIGNFDEGLKVWGGENIELGFRAWQCGGKVVTVTCSHVGHVFKEFPYSFDGNKEEIVQKNLIRVSEVWMDGMRKYFYASTRIFDYKRAELDLEEINSLEKQKALREKLKCHNFDWYLYNIIPQIERPQMNALFHGEITNHKSKGCWEVLDDYYISLTYICYHHKIIPQNYFTLSDEGLMRYRDKCVVILSPDPMLRLDECPSSKDTDGINRLGVWNIDKRRTYVQGLITVTRKLGNISETFCIEQVTNAMPLYNHFQMPQINRCDENNDFQIWAFTYGFDFSRVPKEAL